MQFIHRHRRTAFQAGLLQQFLPRTSSPVTIATLSSAFQAQTLHIYKSISGQNKPFISDGFEVQTIHSQPVCLQVVARISAGLKGLSGKNCVTRARGNIFQSFPKAWQRSVENERLCKASAEAKLAWTMPSRSQRSVENQPISGQDTRRVSALPIAMIGKTLNRCLCAF